MHEFPLVQLHANWRVAKPCATPGQLGASAVLQPMLKHCDSDSDAVLDKLGAGCSTFAGGGGFEAHPAMSTAAAIQRKETGAFIVEPPDVD